MKKRIEIEITPNNWIEISLDQLTDDHEEHPAVDDPEILNGSSWYLDGDYTVPPMEIRIIETEKPYVEISYEKTGNEDEITFRYAGHQFTYTLDDGHPISADDDGSVIFDPKYILDVAEEDQILFIEEE